MAGVFAEDTHVSVVLTQQPWFRNLPECDARLMCLDAEEKAIRSEQRGNLRHEATADTLAYIIYTSALRATQRRDDLTPWSL